MFYIKYQRCLPLDSAWTRMSPLRLGKVSPGLGTPDLFVTIEDDDGPTLRADRYADESCFFREDAVIWGERGFVGFGDTVYVIDPKTGSGSAFGLGSYFAGFYSTENYFLVASGDGLLRFSQFGDLVWKASNLGLDGVVVKRIDEALVRGEGESDPPGGWKPFVLRLDSGELVAD